MLVPTRLQGSAPAMAIHPVFATPGYLDRVDQSVRVDPIRMLLLPELEAGGG